MGFGGKQRPFPNSGLLSSAETALRLVVESLFVHVAPGTQNDLSAAPDLVFIHPTTSPPLPQMHIQISQEWVFLQPPPVLKVTWAKAGAVPVWYQ